MGEDPKQLKQLKHTGEKTPQNLDRARISLIKSFYHLGALTYEDIGLLFNVTRQRIHQLITEDKMSEKIEKIVQEYKVDNKEKN